MNAKFTNLISLIVLIITILASTHVFGKKFQTNHSGNWSEAGLWSEEVKKGKVTDWVIYNASMQTTFSNNTANYEFTINLNDTVYVDASQTLTFDGTHLTFKILGMLIVNGTIDYKGNNSSLTVDGNMVVNGSVSVTGNGGQTEITGSGTISVGENGTFTANENIINVGNGLNILVSENGNVCGPSNLAASVIEVMDKFDVELSWDYNSLATDCERAADLTHFEISRDSQIIALLTPTKSNKFFYTDQGLDAGSMPEYSVRAVYSGPAARSGSANVTFNSPLPIELMYFNVEASAQKIQLTWATAAEINNDFFTIERSSDGNNWEIITYVYGAGNSNYVIDYEFTDELPLEGIAYYRLKQTDFDGQFEYFAPVVVEATKSNTTSEVMNITYNGNSMNVWYQNNSDNTVMMVVDLQGRILSQSYLNAEDYIQNISVPLSGNYAGEIVIVKMVSGEKSAEKKFMIR